MEDDYFSIDSILADNQKIQCIFSKKIPDLGHLWGGSERDIAAQGKYQIPIWMAYIVVYSDWADFNIPTPFGNRVRNALNAEPRSVRLSGLVGAGGLWYGFGKTIMDMLSDEQANEMSQMLTKVSTVRYRDEVTAIATTDVPRAACGGDRPSTAFRSAGPCWWRWRLNGRYCASVSRRAGRN